MRDGTATESLRRKGAKGDLEGPVSEKIEVLVVLSADRDPEVRRQALDTLRHWDAQELDQILSDPCTPSAIIDFVFDHLIEEHGEARAAPQSLAPSSTVPTVAATKGFAADSGELASGDSKAPPSPWPEAKQAPAGAAEPGTRHETLLQRIASMSVSQKVRLALTGSREERLVLIRDPNRVVMRSVIQSPRVTEGEIESFAAMRDAKEEVLRIISKNRAFIRSHAVARALVFNPRSPIDVSLPLIKLLKDRDLKLLTIDKNVPDAVRNSAVRLYSTRTQRK